jgi:hypothetical protein
LTFKEGGAFDFHTIFEQIKERVHQAYTVARESGERPTAATLDVDLEQLPAYECASPASAREVQRETEPAILSPIPRRPTGGDTDIAGTGSLAETTPEVRAPPPDEPPPGYEESRT